MPLLPDPDLLTIPQAAALIGLSSRTVVTLVEEGKLGCVMAMVPVRRVPRRSVLRYLARRRLQDDI